MSDLKDCTEVALSSAATVASNGHGSLQFASGWRQVGKGLGSEQGPCGQLPGSMAAPLVLTMLTHGSQTSRRKLTVPQRIRRQLEVDCF